MELNSRKQLAQALVGVLPEGYVIIDSPRDFASLSGEIVAAVQLYRSSIAPGSSMGALDEEYELWVIEPTLDPETSEDALDQKLADTIEALQPLKWLTWTNAERSQHVSNRNAYKFTITLRSSLTE